jgi:hypothetical protein
VVVWLFLKAFWHLSTRPVDKHVENRLLTALFALNDAIFYKLLISKADIFINKINSLRSRTAYPTATLRAAEKYFHNRYNARRCFL